MLILFLASLATTGYGISLGASGVIVGGAAASLLFGALLRARLRLRAAVNRDRRRWSTH